MKNKCEINDKFVLVLKEEKDNCLCVKKYPIKSTDAIVDKINSIVENRNKSLWDLYSEIEIYFDYNTSYNLCYPYEYRKYFIPKAICPKKVDYFSISSTLAKRREAIISSSYYKNLDQNKKQKYLERELSALKNTIIKREYNKKKEYADMAIRYIKCEQLYKTVSEIKKDDSIKMYSSENIGWTTFTYSLTEDIQITLKTNFLYGSSSYFYVIIKYKDIVLIPYSDLVNYYYANMIDLISYTRSYVSKRESWHIAMEYIANIVNGLKEEPEKFIREYVATEIEDMIKGLREIFQHPEKVLRKVKDNNSIYISMRVVKPFLLVDKEIYEILPRETISVFKAEKITGALMFFDSLNKFTYLCPKISSIMKEVQEMNSIILPEIKETILLIDRELVPLMVKLNECAKKLNRLKLKIEFHTNRIARLQKNKHSSELDDIENRYIERNHSYTILLKQKELLENENYELTQVIKKRERLKQKMRNCLKIYKTYSVEYKS